MATYSVMDLKGLVNSKDELAKSVVQKYTTFDNQRATKVAEWKELRSYLFATDTAHTTSADGTVDWHNKTTLNKLCHIRDNLHANYMSSLFPNDDWLKWEGYSQDSELYEKKQVIQAYMANKTRIGNFKDVVSKLLYDYIDYGVAYADCVFVKENKTDPDSGDKIAGFVGPKAIRISPLDIVFDITANEFQQAPKITRSIVRIGELKAMIENGATDEWIQEAYDKAMETRSAAVTMSSTDVTKAHGYTVDGFGNMKEYYGSGYVELLEFEGSCFDPETGDYLDDYIITVIDRTRVIRKQPIPLWKRGGSKCMTTWRKRSDNLIGMGPLDNLVGMQYRIDHLENAKADAWDLIITPAWKIKGGVREVNLYPGAEVICDNDGDIQPLTYPKEALMVNNEIMFLMNLMEEFAGAPKQAMGIRTPGEKTAFEVQALENAAGRIFQQKIVQFEVDILEPLLNNMLMLAVREMDASDVIRSIDDDYGVAVFSTITKDDITAEGKLRPIGARHFSQRAQIMQNITGAANSPVWGKIERHISDKALAKLFEDSLQLERFSLIQDNAALFEQADAQRLAQQLQEDVAVEQATPIDGSAPQPQGGMPQ